MDRLLSRAACACVVTLSLWSGLSGCAADRSQAPASARDAVPAASKTITVHPSVSDEILYNPGMGFADFHFGLERKPAIPAEHPRSTVAYFRWSWAQLEPEEGRYAFDFVDNIIAQAKAKGETLAFRIMTEYEEGTPAWLIRKGVESFKETDGSFPDYNHPLFRDYHERLIAAFGARYDGSPDIDHVDIGSVGCWGEWNTACCLPEQVPQCERLFPTGEVQRAIVDSYLRHFAKTPLVMLHGGPLAYATAQGAGWRGDCFGDYGYFMPTWNHMDHAYEPVLKDPVVADAWKRGPVQFEVCGYIQDWYDKGFDLERILQKGLEWHVSVLNAKSHPLPAAWRSRLEQFQKELGYRFVLRSLTHDAAVAAGRTLPVRAEWENVGVAPIYRPWPLAYRLRNGAGQIVAQRTSDVDVRTWLPKALQTREEMISIPAGLAPGTYQLDVAILDQAGRVPYVALAIEGQRDDGWYQVSTVAVTSARLR